jgi:hypothetical protein
LARSILTSGRIIGVALALAAVVTTSAQIRAASKDSNAACSVEAAASAPETIRGAYATLLKQLLASPFYRYAAARFGGARMCTPSLETDSAAVTIGFGKRAQLSASVSPSVELSEQRLDTPGLSSERAKILLRQQVEAVYGADACGIDWNNPQMQKSAEPAVTDTLYRGDTCNCQARIRYVKGIVSRVSVRSTC